MSVTQLTKPICEQQPLSLGYAANDNGPLVKSSRPSTKWTYLLSNHIALSNPQPYTIHMKKPNNDVLFDWLIKLVKANQCQRIYVEDLTLSTQQLAYINHLSAGASIEVINVPVTLTTGKANGSSRH